MKTAFLYLRVSTHKQDKSTADQRVACHKYAKQNHIQILDEFEDNGISGYKDKIRPSFNELLEACKKHKPNYVLVWSLDRFSRKYKQGMIELLTLEIIGVKLMDTEVGVYSSDNFGDAVTQVVRQFAAEDFAAKISHAVKRGHKRSRDQGYLVGRSPYGYKRKKSQHGTIWIEDKQISPLVKEAYEKYDAGVPLIQITKAWNMRGLRTPRDKMWHVGTIMGMLSNASFGGYMPHLGDPFDFKEAHIETYIDYNLWLRTYTHLHTKEKPRRSPKTKHPLSGYIVCGSCGGNAIIQAYNWGRYKVYWCGQHKYGACKCRSVVKQEDAEAAVLDLILETKTKQQPKSNRRKLNSLQKKRNNLITAIADIGYNPTLKDKLIDLELQIAKENHDLTVNNIDYSTQPKTLNNLLPTSVDRIEITNNNQIEVHMKQSTDVWELTL